MCWPVTEATAIFDPSGDHAMDGTEYRPSNSIFFCCVQAIIRCEYAKVISAFLPATIAVGVIRIFKGIDKSRVYHFEARSTHRIVKNDGSTQFLRKWGITSASFMRDVLQRGERWDSQNDTSAALKKDLTRSKLKKALTIFRDVKIKNIWED